MFIRVCARCGGHAAKLPCKLEVQLLRQNLVDGRGTPERRIQPGPQVAVDEQLMADEGGKIGQGPAEAGSQFQIFQEQDGDQGRPDLSLHSVGAGSQEGLDLQVLFQGFEEQLDRPAVLVDGGDGRGAEPHVVGQEDDRLLFLRIPDRGAPEEVVVAGLGVVGEEDDLVTENVRCRWSSRR